MIKRTIGRKVTSKWLKTNALLKDKKISKHIPSTRKFSHANLKNMLSTYGMVVIKPNVGSLGIGVIKITKKPNSYSYQYYSRVRTFERFDDMLASIKRLIKGKAYLIQRGIHLIEIDGRPIDFRIKIEKPRGNWMITEMVGRLARKGLFVTNIARGGNHLSLANGLKRALSHSDVHSKRKEMINLTRQCTGVLEKTFPGIRRLGFDYGIDRKRRIWIFEVNTSPM